MHACTPDLTQLQNKREWKGSLIYTTTTCLFSMTINFENLLLQVSVQHHYNMKQEVTGLLEGCPNVLESIVHKIKQVIIFYT